jgi:hypothetical protein
MIEWVWEVPEIDEKHIIDFRNMLIGCQGSINRTLFQNHCNSSTPGEGDLDMGDGTRLLTLFPGHMCVSNSSDPLSRVHR